MDRKVKLKVLTLLPLILEIIALFFLPPEIPIHYNSSFHLDGYGSKYSVLILGVFVMVFGLFMNWIYTKNKETEYKTIIYRLSIAALLIFNVINLLFYINIFGLLFLHAGTMMGAGFSVIGGADGPTAIFIAGSIGDGILLFLLSVTVVVLMGVLIFRYLKKRGE